MSEKTIIDKQQEIISEFEMFDDWMEKYEYIIELGRDLPLIDPELKTEDNLIHGCQSKVWVDCRFSDGKMLFTADSDAIITKGMIGLLIRVLNNESPETILKNDLFFIREIGLQEHLSPTRANGLAGMVKKLKTAALENIA
jgi:cysteine desulfuration protein SufE